MSLYSAKESKLSLNMRIKIINLILAPVGISLPKLLDVKNAKIFPNK